MAAQSLVIFLVIGAVAGWLAGVIVRGYGLGLVGSIVVGVIGSFVGGWLFSHFHLAHGGGLLGTVIGATVGAVILLFLIRLVRRRTFFKEFFDAGCSREPSRQLRHTKFSCPAAQIIHFVGVFYF